MKNIILTGLNGYGGNFIEELLKANNGSYQLVAVVSRNSKKSKHYQTLLNYGIRFYETIESCLENEKVDLAIITTPMHIHYQEVMAALEKGISITYNALAFALGSRFSRLAFRVFSNEYKIFGRRI